MTNYDRRILEDPPQSNLQHGVPSMTRRNSRMTLGTTQVTMPPPPVPVDPALDSFRPSNISLQPAIGLAHSSPLGPELQERPGTFLPGVQLPSLRQADADPIIRFYQDPGPWSSQQVDMDQPHQPLQPRYPTAYAPPHPSAQYRESPRSDVGSNATGRNPMDSGYGSKSLTTKSVRSVEYLDQSQSCQSLTGDINEMQLYPDERFQATDSLAGHDLPYPFDHYPDMPAPSTEPALGPFVCEHTDCGYTESKNQSDHKKHMMRHDKPFHCQEPNCKRKEGFSTNNDLERHRKSVHKIAPKNPGDRSYRCASANCPKRDKIWPRLDNFRQHCIRMHVQENLDVLVRHSLLSNPEFVMSARSVDGYPREPGVQKADQGPWGSQTYAQNSLTQLEDAVNDTEAMFDRSTRVWPDLADPCSQKNRSPTPTNDFNELGKANAESVITKRNYDDPSQAALLSTFNDVNQKLELKETSAESPVERRSDKNGKWPNEQVTAPSKMAKNQAERKDALKVKAEQFSEALSLDIVKRVNEGSIGEIKSIIKTEFLSLFNPIKTLKRSNDEISSSATISDRKRRQVTCEHCSKTMVRSCDLKKHRKRHTRPYGCTFPSCSKVFGSKNDWKRHENTQHYHVAAWRCFEASSNKIKQCAKVFYRREQFQAHLRESHKIESEEEIRERSKRHQVGRNGQTGFWCGFCQKIIKLHKQGLAAWDERFNHIDDSHFKNGETIDNWYSLDKDIPKGLLRNDDVLDSGDVTVDPVRSGSDSDDTGRSQSPEKQPADSPAGKPPKNPPAESRTAKLAVPRKQKRQSEVSTQEQWYCCQCKYGPLTARFDQFCPQCFVRQCEHCQTQDWQSDASILRLPSPKKNRKNEPSSNR